MKNRRTFTLRLEDDLLDKLHFAADSNRRSVNNQIEVLVEKFILDFEKENGVIHLPKAD